MGIYDEIPLGVPIEQAFDYLWERQCGFCFSELHEYCEGDPTVKHSTCQCDHPYHAEDYMNVE